MKTPRLRKFFTYINSTRNQHYRVFVTIYLDWCWNAPNQTSSDNKTSTSHIVKVMTHQERSTSNLEGDSEVQLSEI